MGYGHKTIEETEQALIVNKHGRSKLITGPARVFLWGEQFTLLKRYIADQTHYLIIKFKNGNVEHSQGPATRFFNPIEHESISVQPVISLDANECLVVYRQIEENKVIRRIVTGPQLFVPAPNEWLHEFIWHGSAPGDKAHKIPGATRFTKLRTVPDQFYFNVRDVRTADDALITVKLMLFFELSNIETMLNTTHDPVADFINSSTADIIAFAAKLSYEQFLEQTDKLNQSGTYSQLFSRAERIGYTMTKVVYRGYHASDQLQTMHNNAIQARTKLRLDSETEQQSQELADMKIKRELERNRAKQQIAREETEHQATLDKSKQLTSLEMSKKSHEQKLTQINEEKESELRLQASLASVEIDKARKLKELELEVAKKADEQKLRYLSQLREMGVDLTSYLVSQYQHPDRILRVESQTPTNLHIHEDEKKK